MSDNTKNLIHDAISILQLNPTSKHPISSQDIIRIGELIGQTVSQNLAGDCIRFLMSIGATGKKFKPDKLIAWWLESVEDASNQQEETQPFTTSYNAPTTPFEKQQHTIVLPQLKRGYNSKIPEVYESCQSLLQQIQAKSQKFTEASLLEDSDIRKGLSKCIEGLVRDKKAQSYFREAYQLIEESNTKNQAQIGKQFQSKVRNQLVKTKAERQQQLEQEVDFLMRNEVTSNIGTSLYFLLSPNMNEKPAIKRNQIARKHQKRINEILNGNIY